MRWLGPSALLAGCGVAELPVEQPCVEVGYAIAARYEQCTGDAVGAIELFEEFQARAECRVEDFPLRDEHGEPSPVAYECALVTRNLACELAESYAEDLSAWLGSSPVCDELLVLR